MQRRPGGPGRPRPRQRRGRRCAGPRVVQGDGAANVDGRAPREGGGPRRPRLRLRLRLRGGQPLSHRGGDPHGARTAREVLRRQAVRPRQHGLEEQRLERRRLPDADDEGRHREVACRARPGHAAHDPWVRRRRVALRPRAEGGQARGPPRLLQQGRVGARDHGGGHVPPVLQARAPRELRELPRRDRRGEADRGALVAAVEHREPEGRGRQGPRRDRAEVHGGSPWRGRQQHVRLRQRGHRRRRHPVRQPALPVVRRRAPLPGAPHDPRQDRRAGRVALRLAGRQHRLHRELRVEPHRLDGVPLHALCADPQGGQPARVRPGRRREADHRARPPRRGEGRGDAAFGPSLQVRIRSDDLSRQFGLRMDAREGVHDPRCERRELPPDPELRALEHGEEPRGVHQDPRGGGRHPVGEHHRRGQGRQRVLRRHHRRPERQRRAGEELRGLPPLGPPPGERARPAAPRRIEEGV